MRDAFFKSLWSKFAVLLMLGLGLRVVGAVFSEGTQYPDEHFQILEMASMKLGITDPALLPWEYREAMRPSFQPALAFGVIRALQTAGLSDPFVQTMFLRLITALLSSAALLLLLRAFWEEAGSDRLRSWFVWLSSLLWFLVFQNVRFSSEALAGAFFFIGFGAYLGSRNTGRSTPGAEALAGLLLGLAFITRYQTGFMLAGFGLWLLFVKKEKPGPILWLLLGGILALGGGALLDRWFYGRWAPTAWNYLYQNLILHKAAEYGTSPWWFYFEKLSLQLYPPFSLVFLGSFLVLFIRWPRHVLTWSLLPFILIHFLIGHKEARFLYPLACAIPVVGVLAAASLPELRLGGWRRLETPFWVFNGLLLAVFVLKPAESLLPFYKFAYRNHLTELATVHVVPYSYRRPMFFYRPPGLELHEFGTLEEFVAWERERKRPIVLAVKGFEPPVLPEDLSTRLLFRSLPAWLGHYNINDWLSRTPTVTLCEVTPRP